MLQNAYFLAKIGADTAENEQHFAEILPTGALDQAGPAPVQRPGRYGVLALEVRNPAATPRGPDTRPGPSHAHERSPVWLSNLIKFVKHCKALW